MLSSRYVLLQAGLSAGGQGSIDVYMDQDLERKVAVKTLHAHAESRRLLDEVAALGKIHSNNVVQVYDVDVSRTEYGTRIALIQEFIDGDELTAYIGEHVSLKQALLLLYQLSSALVDVHMGGITHRDVKPQNVKVDSEGIVKLYDFGLARFVPQQSTVGMVGTPGFMAPELRKMGRINFTSAVDVFAFGSTAWCLLQEQSEVDIEDEPELAGYDFVPLALSLELATVLNRTFSSDADARPTMGEIKQLLFRELTRDMHRAQLLTAREVATLSRLQREVNLASENLGAGVISYDGYRFVAELKSGDVYINNMLLEERRELHGSYLITLGAPRLGASRVFVPFDISHPEVTF